MKVSVIIPCHNLEAYIETCLKSVAEQDLDKSEYEVLIVFDCCTDNSEEVALKLLEGSGVNYTSFIVNKRRAGLTRNVGLEHARGKYICFIDGDDYLTDKRALSKLVSAAENANSPVVYLSNIESESAVEDSDAVWRYFLERSFIGGLRFSGLEINEDWEFIMRLKQKHIDICYIDDVLYHYTHPRKDSITYKYINPKTS